MIQAKLRRADMLFPGFHRISPFNLHIQYPVELSVVKGGMCIVVGDSLPVTLKVRNHSLWAIGTKAAHPRLLRIGVSLCVADAHDWEPSLSTCHNNVETVFTLANPMQYDLTYLGPGEELMIECTISIGASPVARLHEHLPMQFSLSLGDIAQPLMTGAMTTIQQELLYVQIADRLEPLDANDLLLVINCTTTKVCSPWIDRSRLSVPFSSLPYYVQPLIHTLHNIT
jgi:hypothetical protein